MIIENIQFHSDLEWEQYLQLPATSFSGLKNSNPIEETYGMKIGSLVHRYLLKPSEYNYEEAEVVIPIAMELVKYIGSNLLKIMVAEQPATADFIHDGFVLRWKGIPDIFIPKVIVIDIKVIAGGTLAAYCERFGYKNQIRGYMCPTETEYGIIIAYNRAKKKVEVEFVFQDHKWWEQQILSRGDLLTTKTR